MRGLIDKSFQSGTTIPVDPLDLSQMGLRQSILNNRLDNKVQYAKECILEDEIKNLVTVARDFDWRLRFDEEHMGKVLNLVGELLNETKNGGNWKKMVGSTLQTSAYALWTIPGVNVLWGTAAYAAGSFLKWIGLEEAEEHLNEAFMHTRMNILDNVERNMRDEDVQMALVREKTDEDRIIIVNDWLHETEEKIRTVERVVSGASEPFHGLLFWKDSTNPNFLGVSIGVGIPDPGVWMFGVNLNDNNSMLNFMSFSRDTLNRVVHWMSMSSQHRFVNTASVGICSYATSFLVDNNLVSRFNDLSKFCKVLTGSVAERRMHIFNYLNGQ